MKRESIFHIVAILLIAVLLEFIGYWILAAYPALEKTRELLQGKIQPEIDVNATPQPYLLYIPTPNFSAHGVQQNNSQGYRGSAVPLVRTPDSLRVLFLGGSTTYGEGVEYPEDSYPAQLGQLLQRDPNFSGKNIEIINAGLRYGTTAEILTHYLLKYRYYKPDLVIINPGGNDPVAYVTKFYQPDYSNWRKTPQLVTELQPRTRWFLQSKFISAFVVLMFFPDVAEGTTFVHRGESTPARWFHSRVPGKLQLDEVAFYNNLSATVREIQHDGAKVFLLSYQGNPFDSGDQQGWRKYYDFEETILQKIGIDLHVAYAAYPLSLMPEPLWVDASHVNKEGEAIKAGYVYEKIKPMLHDLVLSISKPQSSKLQLKQGNSIPVLDIRNDEMAR